MSSKVNKTTWLLLLLVIAAIIFGLHGWMEDEHLGFNDALYRTLSTLFGLDTYQDLVEQKSGLSLNIARWCGLLAIIMAASKAVMHLLSERLTTWRAHIRQKHLMIIGDNAFAEALASVASKDGRKVTWLAASSIQKNHKTKKLFIHEGKWNLDVAGQFGLARAKSVTIAISDDAKTIAIARQIRKKYPDENKLIVHVSISALWLAMRFDEVKGVDGIHLISAAQVAIRQTHRKHPPFLIAKKWQHKRIHSVIFGFGLYGEAVLIDTVLSCLTTYLEKPCFTIIDPQAKAIKNNLDIKYPELYLSADIDFIQRDIEGLDHSLSEADLRSIIQQDPITASYICLSAEGNALSAGIKFQTLIMRNGWDIGPIFVRLSTEGALPTTDAGISHLEHGQLLSFGNLKSLIKDTGILNDDVDGLARTLHKAYQSAAGPEKAANVSWKDLGEDMRDSNRRVVTHIAAKLSSAGVDIEPWLKKWDQKPNSANLPRVEGILEDEALMVKLAELEHERWMADRRINGWQYGKERDNDKRNHPDLVPYVQLSKDSQAYDLLMVQTLAEILAKY